MATAVRAHPALEVSKAFFDLMTSETPPRFPRVAAEFGLPPQGLGLMRMLHPGDALPMKELAAALSCEASNFTGIVDRLEERGLVERRADSDDRRVKRLALTPAGEAERERMLERLYEPPEAIRRLSRADQRQLAALLKKALQTA